jgi:hypothetical protein
MKRSFTGWATAALLVLTFIVSGCGALNKDAFDKDIYEESFNTLQESAVQYMDKGDHEETVYITRALLNAEPDNRQVKMLQDQALAAEPSSSILMKKSILGSNLTNRVVNEGFPWWGRVLLYIPNRVFDLLDLVTLEVGYCFGIGAKVQVTDFTSIGAQLSTGSGVAGLNRRHLSVRAGQEEYFHFLPFGAILLAEVRASSGSNYSLAMYDAGIKFPSDLIYQNARDFWAIGAEAQALLLAANVKLHPIEFFDLLCGFVFYDPLKDDLGSTRPINTNLWLKDIQALKDLTYQTRLR